MVAHISFQGGSASGSSGDSASSLVAITYNAKKCRKLLARMIIIDELSFSFVENESFRDFIHGLQPRFSIPSRSTIARDCMQLYMSEKKKLKSFLNKTRQKVCLTTDCWTSVQNLNYLVITAHFINSEWKLHKRILNFCQIFSHKGEAIGKCIEKCLIGWGIDRVFTITVDNASSNDVAINYLSKKIKNWNGLSLNGEFLHVRCCAHILNLVVVDGLRDLNDAIVKIRNVIRYVRSSSQRLQKFKICAEMEKISSKSLVCLDVSTGWNTTYLMLDTALKFQKAFERMEEQDDEFSAEFNGVERTPSVDDWTKIEVFLKFLKVFYEITVRVSGSFCVTSNKYFQEIYLIHGLLQEYSSVGDHLLKEMARNMKVKYEKYWRKPEKTNFLMYVAIVFEPRHKIKPVAFCLRQMHGEEVGAQMIAKVEAILRSLYAEYKNETGVVKVEVGESQTKESEKIEEMFHFGNVTRHLYTEDNNCKTEVDRYLLESCEEMVDSFDILKWWKVNSSKYKILSQVAKDVLAIPISTVASKSAFNTSGRVLDQFRSSLSPKAVEALVCAKNWLRSSPIPIDIHHILEEIETLDQELVEEELIAFDE